MKTVQGKITEYLYALKDHDLNPDHRIGGYLTIFKGEGSNPILSVFLGEEDDENRISLTRELSMEKCLRLMKNPQHSTSHESRDEKKNQYGGGVRFDFPTLEEERLVKYYIGFSGCPELQDEAMVLAGYYRFSNDSRSLSIPGKRINPLVGTLVNRYG